MASLVLSRVGRLSVLSGQRWASAAAVPLTEPVDPGAPLLSSRKPPEDVKITKLGNGITVASMENQSSISNLSVYVKAGSRYESYSQQGATHLLRNCAFLGTGNRTAFRIAREIDILGGTLNVSSTRENMIYSAEFLRGNLAPVVDTLGSVITLPKLEQWEVKDQRPRALLDLAIADTQPNTVVMEALHRAAFRNALSNPVYCPTFNVSRLTNKDLKSYMDEWFLGRRLSIVGVGVNHDELVKCAELSFSALPEGVGVTEEKSEYVGGSEIRIPSGSVLTHAAIVSKGASLSGAQNDLTAAGVLQHLLGATPHGYTKWGSNSTGARLSKAGAIAVDAPFAVTSLNLSYSDNGLFGMYLVCDGSNTGALLRAVMKEFNEVAKGSVSEEDFSRAKNQLKASYLMSLESQSNIVEDIAAQTSLKGSYSPLEETLKQVDSVSKDDVVQFAKNVFSTRPSFVAQGNLSTTPRLDQLLAESLK